MASWVGLLLREHVAVVDERAVHVIVGGPAAGAAVGIQPDFAGVGFIGTGFAGVELAIAVQDGRIGAVFVQGEGLLDQVTVVLPAAGPGAGETFVLGAGTGDQGETQGNQQDQGQCFFHEGISFRMPALKMALK